MQRTKSYMLPKLILVNMLAVIMMTFEPLAPAVSSPKANAEAQPVAKASSLVQTAAVAEPTPRQPVVVSDTPAQPKTAVQKKRVRHGSATVKPATMLVKARHSPVDCCFRGNRT